MGVGSVSPPELLVDSNGGASQTLRLAIGGVAEKELLFLFPSSWRSSCRSWKL